MRKGLTAQQEKELVKLKQTYPTFKLTSYTNLGRLRKPSVFPYSHKSRLCNEITNEILQSFQDVNAIFLQLPESYRLKIISDYRFNRILTDNVLRVLKHKESRSKKPTEKAEQYESYVIASNLFSIGLENLIRSMPTEFQNYLLREVTPLMEFMQSIADFYRRVTGRFDIPYPYVIPETLSSSVYLP